jgi:hypothetical protein
MSECAAMLDDNSRDIDELNIALLFVLFIVVLIVVTLALRFFRWSCNYERAMYRYDFLFY